MLKIRRIVLETDIKAAEGGVALIAPGRASKKNKPFRAQFDAASEAWRKQVSHQWASDTSDNYRQTHAGRLRRPLAIINRIPHTFAPVAITPLRAIATPLDVGLLLHRGFAAVQLLLIHYTHFNNGFFCLPLIILTHHKFGLYHIRDKRDISFLLNKALLNNDFIK